MNDQETLFPMPRKELSETEIQQFGKPRILQATRNQIEIQFSSLDDQIDENHPVRQIWSYVEKLDLSTALNLIKSVDGNVGRPAIDPKILIALWLYATIEGIGSARVLARYTKEHSAFRWLCGNVSIERKSISDFRVNNGQLFDDILAQGVAILVKADVVKLEEISQDGLRVRAHAGRGSFRREETIDELYQLAKKRVEFLKNELEEDPNECTKRQKINKQKAAENKLKRIEEAKEEIKKFKEEMDKNRKKHKKKLLTEEEKDKMKVSTTDPEARIMKMPDGGYRPAYNFQYAVDMAQMIVVGVDVVNAGIDGGQMLPMYEQIKNRYKKAPERYLADGGFKSKTDIEQISKEGCEVYIPIQENSKEKKVKNIHQPKINESKEIANWRLRMSKKEAKEIYKRRVVVEHVNAYARNRGLYRIVVRGLKKAKDIATMFAEVHNMARSFTLGII
jgi:transposase